MFAQDGRPRRIVRRWSSEDSESFVTHAWQYFNFKGFPIDVAARVLVFAIAAPKYWKTYQSLIMVSRKMKALAYDACLPHLPIMLHTKKNIDSFCALLTSDPTVGPRIRAVWMVASVKADVECTMGLIFQKCSGITHIACNINLLRVLVGSSETLELHELKHLTLIEPKIPWTRLLCQPAARQLFSQLTHFRASGGTELVLPKFCFASLTHLSFTCHSLPSGLSIASPFDSVRFPVLQQIVPSIPYMQCRLEDPKALKNVGRSVDDRVDIIACPKKWKESEIWESGIHGEKDLWDRARLGEYQQRSRAFTEELPKWDWEDYEFGGESGL